MTLRSAQECVCRVLDDKREDDTREDRPFVILTGEDTVKEVAHMVGASMPEGSECFGSAWRSPTGEIVSVKRYSEPVPEFPTGFDLAVCNGGREYTSDERRDLKRWRDAAK